MGNQSVRVRVLTTNDDVMKLAVDLLRSIGRGETVEVSVVTVPVVK